MAKFREVKMPSGAVLKITPAPFADSKALYQAFLEEAKGVQLNAKGQVGNLLKDLICSGFSSQKVEAALWVCMGRCIYNAGKGDLKIDQDTFEEVEARQDYMDACMEVAKENVGPFTKGLPRLFSQLSVMIGSIPK